MSLLARHRLAVIAVSLLLASAILVLLAGTIPVMQATVSALVAASYISLGAVGLTLVFGILRLVNFAHGDMMTFGAYVALMLYADLGLPFWVTVLIAILATALLGVASEILMWRPMRSAGASTFQLLLMAIGFALVVRNAVQFAASGELRRFDLDIVSTVGTSEIRIGVMQLWVVIVGFAVLIGVGLMLKRTRLGKEMRALADNFDLAETSGIDTRRVILWAWALAAGLAGLAGVLYGASIGVLSPNLGVSILLSLFAAAVLGGIGDAYGALLGGLLIALAQEWSTLFLNTRWKPAVGFVILIATLLVLPSGLAGRKQGP